MISIYRVEEAALLLRKQYIGQNISNLYLKKLIKMPQQSLDVGFFFHFTIFIQPVFRVTRLRIDPNNINTYYYKNTTKG